MQSPLFVPVILAGGSGERFWPLSRKAKPKQFLTLDNSPYSLLQNTQRRLQQLTDHPEQLFVVTSNDYRSLVLEQLPDLPLENLLVEPMARDTAPAVLFAALSVAQHYPDAVMGIFPSDHRIGNEKHFLEVVRAAAQTAHTFDSIVTLGINPSFASTGYGYIKKGPEAGNVDGFAVHQVAQFTEKPDRERAEKFIASGEFSWNSGVFIVPVQALLREYQLHQPELYHQLKTAMQQRGGVREVFPTLDKISFDYAIVEKTHSIMVMPADFGWDDLGDWNALERLMRSENPNVSVGKHVGLDTEGAILFTTSGDDLIVTIGLDDVVIVRTSEVTLVVKKDRTQDIKKVVQGLKNSAEYSRYA